MKTTLPTLLVAGALCASGLAARPARAQFDPYSYQGPIDHVEIYERQRELINPSLQTSKSTVRTTGGVGKTTPKKALNTTTYRASPAVSRRMKTRFIASLIGGLLPADTKEMKTGFEERDWIGLWANHATAIGLKRGDVKDALAFYMVDSWLIANDVAEARTRASQFQGVRRQMGAGLPSNPAFAKLSNAARQEMAEDLIYAQTKQRIAQRFALRIAVDSVATEGDEALQKHREVVNAGFKKVMGFDLRAVKLTDNGFAPK